MLKTLYSKQRPEKRDHCQHHFLRKLHSILSLFYYWVQNGAQRAAEVTAHLGRTDQMFLSLLPGQGMLQCGERQLEALMAEALET